MNDFFKNYMKTLFSLYPKTASNPLAYLSANHISSRIIEIPHSCLDQVNFFVSIIFKIRNHPKFQTTHIKNSLVQFDPGHFSVLMGYDFHLTENHQLKLIEINTNAAFSLLQNVLNHIHQLPSITDSNFIEVLKESFINEFKNFKKGKPHVAIVDHDILNQNFLIEFLMFKELFESWGWSCILSSPNDLIYDKKNRILYDANNCPVDLIYNRLTDFFLNSEESKNILQSYLDKAICLTPNPHEYGLLSSKDRLIILSDHEQLASFDLTPTEIEFVLKTVPNTIEITNKTDPIKLWEKRKSLFFKPLHSFGGKRSYRGERITKKIFNEICSDGFIAQEYFPAPIIENSPDESQPLKYDLRFYGYRNQIQLAAARTYHGQVTNFQSPFGGFASVKFIK